MFWVLINFYWPRPSGLSCDETGSNYWLYQLSASCRLSLHACYRSLLARGLSILALTSLAYIHANQSANRVPSAPNSTPERPKVTSRDTATCPAWNLIYMSLAIIPFWFWGSEQQAKGGLEADVADKSSKTNWPTSTAVGRWDIICLY